jgi:hypothetical protein
MLEKTIFTDMPEVSLSFGIFLQNTIIVRVSAAVK